LDPDRPLGFRAQLMNIATGKEPRPPEVDKFVEAFSFAGEK
jgi:hypothetical protein